MQKDEIRVGLLGLGTVGTGVAEILERHQTLIQERTGARVRIVRALVQHLVRTRPGASKNIPVTDVPKAVLDAQDIDIVVELMGGLEPARSYMTRALQASKPVVTANKAVMAKHGPELLRLSRDSRCDLYFEAAVAGGIPIIRTLREGLASDRVTYLSGILNGTTNYILGRMEAGLAYDEALRQAQALGYAEADPSLDVNGGDAADKLAILILLAYGKEVAPHQIPREGITDLTPEVLADAQRLGYRVKLIGVAKRVEHAGDEYLDARVHPCFVPLAHPLSTVSDALNAVWVESDALGPTLYQGAGAGGLPTGSAVVSNIIEAARNLRAQTSGRSVHLGSAQAPTLLPPGDAHSAYYLRLEVEDRPGVLASVATILGQHGVSLATVLQHERSKASSTPVPVILTTHPTPHGAMLAALGQVGELNAVHGRVHVVRIDAD